MANQKAMNEKKFEGIMWKKAGDVFTGSKDISRKPFGLFTVMFEMRANSGETAVQVKNWTIAELSRKRETYATFKEAVNAVTGYFEGIDELVKNVPKTVQSEAEKAYKRIIASAVSTAIKQATR